MVQTNMCKHISINGNIVWEKTLQIATHLGVNNFTVSNVWINRCMRRHIIVYRTLAGEHGNVVSETLDDWKMTNCCKRWKNMLMRLIFFSICKSSKSLTFCGDPCHPGTNQNSRPKFFLYVMLVIVINYQNL
jgi:hypothetical protein